MEKSFGGGLGARAEGKKADKGAGRLAYFGRGGAEARGRGSGDRSIFRLEIAWFRAFIADLKFRAIRYHHRSNG